MAFGFSKLANIAQPMNIGKQMAGYKGQIAAPKPAQIMPIQRPIGVIK